MSGSRRESVGKKDAKLHRRSGKVPCVLYGGKEQIHFTVDEKNFDELIFTPHVHITTLDIDGQQFEAILQDVQYHPVTDLVLHADFMELKPGKKVTVALPFHLNGIAKGVLQGGKLFKKKRNLRVHGLPEFIPEYIEVDVTELNVGQSVRVENITLENLQLMDAPRDVVVTVASTRVSATGAPGEAAPEAKQS
jgi:large subunit ribosomal protein L25